MNPLALSPASRQAAIDDLAATSRGIELDVLVIGGGVVGTGCALDAVTRGLTTGLIEARDFASGTSSRSSKLIHGGLRYLEMFDFRLVHEALQERGLLLTRLAPHLVRPVPFLYPLTHAVWERPYVEAGLTLYDSMARGSGNAAGLPWHKHLSRRGALKIAPALKRSALVGAVQYYDAKVDDARHTMELARTAATYGAHVASRVAAVGFLRQGERVTGVRAVDKITGREFEIHARQVVNSTGVWTDETQAMIGERGQFHVRASKGIHLVVPRDRIHSTSGIILRTEKSVLFVIPWGRHWIIGTTDTDWSLDKAHPAATSADITYLLDHVNRFLTTHLTQADVEGVYAGLRPLLAGESDETSKLSREHVVNHPTPGLVVVAGGKYTTYRVMAKDAIDETARTLGGSVPESTTQDIPMVGAVGFQAVWNRRAAMARESGVHVERIEKMLLRHGVLTSEVLALIADDAELGQPLPGGEDYLKAEIVYAASHEGALHLDDILARRTRLSIESWDRAVGASRTAAELVAPVLGWDAAGIDSEVEHYAQRVEAERVSQTMPDDRAADGARLMAPDING
ncbi:glycerol-3-phosphate dehydrogenase/oxidase [Lapillicoccus sp.]|uniref:glycerol-3-phosphate dehydrogenase/oxidase n=1 Tax=Lapillicoccus sp. TaxID=1909287 RepID=UPI0025CF8C2F|nr:glycerol-3-phosphate dehydrogenase/oxidase [Lapillicoccus sp.]